MASNKSKIDQLHDLLPGHLNTKTNTNWKALVEALGETDQETASLVSEVRKQFFVKTASRPYIDRLAANNKIARPRFVGMDDPSFRQYIPVLSYQPKQVKLIIDQLLDIFFFKESTTAFITSTNFGPFDLDNEWELELYVDEQHTERIIFKSTDFTDINSASSDEIVAAFNRQAKYSYATVYYDSVTKNTFIRVFTNTIGSKGSIRILGGRVNIALRFNGFIDSAGNGSNTEWTVAKVGDQVTFTYTNGANPNLSFVQEGDIFISNIPGNRGSFTIKSVDLVTNSITFTNLFGNSGIYVQSSSDDTKFIRPQKYVAYVNPKRAITWETAPGEITVEMPTSPPVVKRSLRGSVHINGVFSQMANRDSDTSMTLADAYQFPETGTFVLEQVQEIKTRILTPNQNEIISRKINSRLNNNPQKYEYTSRLALSTTGDIVEGSSQITNLSSTVGLAVGQQIKMTGVHPYARVTSIAGNIANISFPATLTATGQLVKFLGNQLTGITPNLPELSSLNEFSLSSLSRSSNVITAITSSAHNYSVGENVIISGSNGILKATTTGNTTILSSVITNIASMTDIVVGMVVAGPGIPIGTKVTSVGINSVTMNGGATSSNVGATITFSEDLNLTGRIDTVGTNTFTFYAFGSDGAATVAGDARVERIAMSNSGSKVIAMDAVTNDASRIIGSYIWDQAATFVLSSNTATISDPIQAGRIVRLLNTTANTMAEDGGFVMFDYGRETEEGPVRYLYKPTSNTIAIDPSYTFKYSHSIGSPIVALSRKGPHRMSSNGAEYSAYVTDPSEARFILQDLIRSVKSAGIFVNFLIRYPDQLYATLDVYNSGIDPG